MTSAMSAVQVVGERPRGDAHQVAVPIAVQGDPVTGGRDLGGERAVALDLLADQEERRAYVAPCEDLQDGRRPARVRPVVGLIVQIVMCPAPPA